MIDPKVYRAIDISLIVLTLPVTLPLVIFALAASFFDTGSPIFAQRRIGKDEKAFLLLKVRTVSSEAPDIPTHLLPERYVSKFGRALRRSKLDELPQLFNVIAGSMSLVGPRPCLLTQEEVIEARKEHALYSFAPGITGLAQIRGITMAEPERLAKADAEMMKNLSVISYFSILFQTVFPAARK